MQDRSIIKVCQAGHILAFLILGGVHLRNLFFLEVFILIGENKRRYKIREILRRATKFGYLGGHLHKSTWRNNVVEGYEGRWLRWGMWDRPCLQPSRTSVDSLGKSHLSSLSSPAHIDLGSTKLFSQTSNLSVTQIPLLVMRLCLLPLRYHKYFSISQHQCISLICTAVNLNTRRVSYR